MQKFDIVLPQGRWGGIKSKFPPDSQQVTMNDFSEGTFNVETDVEGIITKRKGGVEYAQLSSEPKDQYEAIFEDGSHHLLTVQNGAVEYSSGDGSVNSVTDGSGFTASANFEFATVLNRVYGCNGANPPQVYDRVTSYGGATPVTAPIMKVMGCQVPVSGFAFDSFQSGGNVPDGSYTYEITYLYYGFEESNGALETGTITVASPNSTVRFDIPVGGYGVSARKIYRSVLGTSNFILVGTVTDNTTVTFDDDQAAGTFPIPTINDLPPTFQNINLFLDRVWISGVSGSPYVLQFSDVGLPDIFPGRNFIRCNQEDPIVAHVVFNGKIIILNRQSIGQVLGRNRFQFRYDPLPDAVGCVDSRTVQIRTVQGIPLLIWLSDKGFYAYNGNSVNYISEDIEDLVNFNIQQAQFTKGQNSQSSQTDFQAGTPGPGVDLTLVPGSITSKNPKETWDDVLDWDGGETKTNIVTKAGDNKLKAPLQFSSVLGDGTFTGDILEDSGDLKLETVADLSTINQGDDSNRVAMRPYLPFTTEVPSSWAQKITLGVGGTINNFKMWSLDNSFLSSTPGWDIKFGIYSDIGGSPSAPIWLSNDIHIDENAGGGMQTHFFTPNLYLPAGDYWFVYDMPGGGGVTLHSAARNTVIDSHLTDLKVKSHQAWVSPSQVGATGKILSGPDTGNFPSSLPLEMSFTQDIQGSNGEWLSAIYDTESDDISVVMNLINGSAIYPASTSSLTVVEGSDNALFSTGVQESQQINDLDGTEPLTISGKRYWRIRVLLDAQDNVNTPIYGEPQLKFNSSATWVSQAIDCTGDVSTYDALTIVDSIPSGTTLVYEVATSDDDISYTSYGPIGSATVKRYLKLKITLTQNTAQTLTPEVISVKFTWIIITQFESSSIDTGVVPAGWDIFLSSFTTNGAPVVFKLRSAATLGALPGASYTAIVPGNFPTTTPLQFAQWIIDYTVTEDTVPIINDVTLNWFVATAPSIRAASIFFDKTYSLSVAEFGETKNNIIIELDHLGNWRIKRGVAINTLSLFFNEPYYGDGNNDKIVRFNEGTTDLGADIELDVRTRDLTFNPDTQIDDIKTKIMKQVLLTGSPTGATYQVYFSIDEGSTWVLMTDQAGQSSYTCPETGPRWERRWVADQSIEAVTSGRTMMVRIHNNDDKEVKIRKIRIKGFVRKNSNAYTETV